MKWQLIPWQNKETTWCRDKTWYLKSTFRSQTLFLTGRRRRQQQLKWTTSRTSRLHGCTCPCACICAWTSQRIYGSRGFVFVFFQLQVVAARRKIKLFQESEIRLLKTLCTATLVRESEQEQLCMGEEWFLHEMTVCFSAWCFKLC